MQAAPFAKLANPDLGRVPIQYREVGQSSTPRAFRAEITATNIVVDCRMLGANKHRLYYPQLVSTSQGSHMPHPCPPLFIHPSVSPHHITQVPCSFSGGVVVGVNDFRASGGGWARLVFKNVNGAPLERVEIAQVREPGSLRDKPSTLAGTQLPLFFTLASIVCSALC